LELLHCRQPAVVIESLAAEKLEHLRVWQHEEAL